MRTEQHETLHETALVIRIEDDIAWVNTRAKLACSSCKVESTCGNGILDKYLSGKLFVSQLKNNLNAKVGDEIELSIAKQSITQASLLVYFVPLLAAFIGAYIGQMFYQNEPLAIGLATLAMAVSFWGIKRVGSYLERNEKFHPKMVKITRSSMPPANLNTIKLKQI